MEVEITLKNDTTIIGKLCKFDESLISVEINKDDMSPELLQKLWGDGVYCQELVSTHNWHIIILKRDIKTIKFI